ncbi:PhoX family protein [Phenylobacterium sp. J367]|uniref:PhoX family protein n=1 Tax=Phenylobacterium sp. J367 TaxID=2898435 RepID=UPI00215103C5|nr:PhoX family protein [Phenylobacterium sp. J367]MCR5879065.1 PhoX family protein [Phenylobacterium sp. J367]
MSVSRRHFLAFAATSAAFAGLARANAQPAPGYRKEIAGYGPLVPDPAGVFDLPEGFSYKVVSKVGQPMDDGFLTPGKHDGMACFPDASDPDRVILIRNHEQRPSEPDRSAFGKDGALAAKLPAGKAYDLTSDKGLPMDGGTSTLVWDVKRQRLVTHHLSLIGTAVNCAGGRTPARTWLSCEETEMKAGEGGAKDHGWVFEVPADLRGVADPVPLTGMGRFKHEATATDPRTGIVYLTEDFADGFCLFYRYLPNDKAKLAAGGRLQALGFKDAPKGDSRNWDGRFWAIGDKRKTTWIDLEGVDNPHNDLRHRGHARGAAWFARGEGIYFGDGELYFTCTSGGPTKDGQVMRYRPSPREGRPGETDRPGEIELFLETGDRDVLFMPDNLAIAPNGHLFLCEDKYAGQNMLKAVTPKGQVYTVGRNAVVPALKNAPNTELAGVCFSPDGSTCFLNIYYPGMTIAITGPWAKLKA